MSWGVFKETEDGNTHVSPVKEENGAWLVANGHILSVGCWCNPVVEGQVLVIHNDPDWPGSSEEEEPVLTQ